MRQNFIKTTSIILIALFALTSFFPTDGLARHHRHDRPDFPSSKRIIKLKKRQEKRALHQARLKKKRERKLSRQKSTTLTRRKGSPLLGKSVTPPSQNRTIGSVLPANVLFFATQGNIQRINKHFINVSDITSLQRRQINFVTRTIMPSQTQNVAYGFSHLGRANFDFFIKLMHKRTQSDIFLLAYLS